MKLLKDLCQLHGPSGNEREVAKFIVDYISRECEKWHYKPTFLHGDGFQDNIILVFGKPRTAIFAHMDSTGFTVRYENQLVPIGSPDVRDGYKIRGSDTLGPIECSIKVEQDNRISYSFGRAIQTGTDLVFASDFRETKDYVQSCYLDNRLGVYVALRLAEELKDGIIIFSTWEEHGGGSVPFLTRYIYEKYNIKQALICDITWVTDGVRHGDGVAISLRDRNIPRKCFVNKVVHLAEKENVPFQLEVEGSGSSDGREVHHSPYPIDWCFIGAPEDNVHSPDEKVHKNDIVSMLELYKVLMEKL